MITLNASGGSVTFTFSGNSTYLNDGTITVPVNSLALIIDESDFVTFKKSHSNDIFVSANIAEFGMTKAELESWYKANMVGSTGGGSGSGVTPSEVQTMIDESISGKADSSAVTEEISAAVSGKANSSDVYTTGQTSGATEIANALNGKLDATAYTPVQVSTAITENDTNAVAGGAVYDKVHVTSGNGSTTLLTFGSELIPGSGMISAATNYQSGVTKFNIELDLTQWGRWYPILGFYDSNNNDYGGQIINTDGVITYADRSDTMYGTSMSATTSYTNNVFTIEVTGLSGDAPSGLTMFGLANMEPVVNAYAIEGESVEYWIKDYVDAKVAESISGKQDTLSAGTGIEISGNVISATGGGSSNLPISAGTGSNSIIENSPYNKATSNYTHAEGYSTSATNAYSHAEGYQTLASGQYAHAEGLSTTAQTYCHSEGYQTNAKAYYSHAEGGNTVTNNRYEHASGRYNVSSSASTTFGNSGNTLFSVGNGTAENARHNAFEIRQNGDIYCSDGTNDVKLQDTITATAANTTALGGLKLVKLTQSAYDALSPNYDSNTLYVING